MKKGAGIVLTIIGAICAIIGIVKMNSWEYALAAELGMDTTQVQMILYGGIAALLIRIVLIVVETHKEK